MKKPTLLILAVISLLLASCASNQTYAQQEENEGHLVPVPHEITPDVDQIQQNDNGDVVK